MEKNGHNPDAHSMMIRSNSRKPKGNECETTGNWIEKKERRPKKWKSEFIERNDIVVNMHVNEIKVEEGDNQHVVVKQEQDVDSDSFIHSVEQINEDVPVKIEYPEAVVVTDDTESIIFTDSLAESGQDSSSNNFVEGRHSERGAPSKTKTAEGRTVTVYKAKLITLKCINQNLRRTLTKQYMEIEMLQATMKRLELKLAKGTHETVKHNDDRTTRSIEGGNLERTHFNQFSVRHGDQVTWYQPGPSSAILTKPRHPPLKSKGVQHSEDMDVFEQLVRFLIDNRKQTDQVNCTDEIFKKFRLICKNWKETVDRVLQNENNPLQMTLCSDSNVSLFQFKRDFSTPCSTIIDKFFSMRKKRTKKLLHKLQIYAVKYPSFNPFLNGHLMIDVDCKASQVFRNIWSPFSNLVVELVKKFGAKVFYLTVRVQLSAEYASDLDIKWDLQHISNSFVALLYLTPNVKSLCMEWNVDGATLDRYQSIKSIKVPNMKNLTVIQNSGGVILCDILARNQHICKLRLDGCVKEMEKLVEMNFPNLTELVIFPAKGAYYRWDFSKLKFVLWPLERLTLICPEDPYRHLYLYITNILMSPVKSTLQYLSLDVSTSESLLRDLGAELNTPLLTHLRIKSDYRLLPADYFESVLKRLQLLTTLEIEVISTGEPHFKLGLFNSIFLSLIKSLSKASYWKRLPNLKRTKVSYVMNSNETMIMDKAVIERNDLPAECFLKRKLFPAKLY